VACATSTAQANDSIGARSEDGPRFAADDGETITVAIWVPRETLCHRRIATAGFAALGIVTPDYIVPAGFLFTDGATVNYAGVDSVTYGALPVDGTSSLNRSGMMGVNSPTNFAGQSGTINATPPPAAVSVPTLQGARSARWAFCCSSWCEDSAAINSPIIG
jgi:hypothetical protein